MEGKYWGETQIINTNQMYKQKLENRCIKRFIRWYKTFAKEKSKKQTKKAMSLMKSKKIQKS